MAFLHGRSVEKLKKSGSKRRNINREEMHREIRIMLAEQNLPDEERIFYEMLEDMYQSAEKTVDPEQILEKWEQWYLSKR